MWYYLEKKIGEKKKRVNNNNNKHQDCQCLACNYIIPKDSALRQNDFHFFLQEKSLSVGRKNNSLSH